MIGTNFLGRYRIEDALGQGGMGMVYRAHDQLLDRNVAIKVLNKSELGTEGKAQLLYEAQAAAQLQHPNIVSIYDAGDSDGVPFIVMELVEGRSLHEQSPSSLDELLKVITQVCAALEHAHKHGIVHRDLKPENVIVTADGAAKLTDFGLARSVASRLTREGNLVGSVFYLAPELALGQPFDGRADLYSLGVMLYELTTGGLPFTAGDPLAVISQHLHAPPVPPRARNPELPPGLDALILRLLSKAPEDRPASAAEVSQALEQLAEGSTEAGAESELSLLDRIIRGRMVGRQHELAELHGLWQKAIHGESRVVLVSGEPGIGKSRLARELEAKARVQRAFVLSGECYSEGNAAYAPVAQMIEAAANFPEFGELPALPDLLTLAPGLRSRFSSPAGEQTDPQELQARLYESVVELCTALNLQAPVLIVLEDAHWADSGTLALIRFLARRASKLRLKLLILITYREIELDQAGLFSEVLYDFHREHLAHRIKLGRLDMAETGALLAAIFDEQASAGFLEGIYQETEGNPFFVEEVCKALIEEGKLIRQAGHWAWPRMDETEIPQSIKVAIQARLGKLPPPANETLRVAAIFGREFDFATLRDVCELDEDTVLNALESAEKAQLVTELRQPARTQVISSPTFIFVHALIASTLRESMSGLRRQRLHQRAGLALERLNPDRLPELAPQLGFHFAEAGDWDKACNYLLMAGERARQLFAYLEAIKFYEQALLILKDQGETERAARALMKLGLLYHASFDFKRSRQAYQEGFVLWQHAGEGPVTPLPPAPRPLYFTWQMPLTLDPNLSFEGVSAPIIDQLFSGLVDLTPDLDVTPNVARSWEVLDSGRRYLFHLRQDASWSDGTPVTAGDFEFAWKRLLDPQTGSRNPLLLYDIKGAQAFHKGETSSPDDVGVKALDAYTLQVELEEPIGYFLHLLTYTALYPLPRHIVEAKGPSWTAPENLVTNGPFIVDSQVPNKSTVLVRNPHYHGRFAGNLERVEISHHPYKNRSAAHLALYEADLLDISGPGGRALDAERAIQRYASEYVSTPLALTQFLIFISHCPPFDNVLVRRAFAYALDRETFAEVIQRGIGSPATGGIVPPGLPGHQPEIGLPFSPDKARQLMAEAGYPQGTGFPPVEFWGPGRESQESVDFLVQQFLDILGIELRAELLEAGVIWRRQASGIWPHIYWNGWLADYPDPDNFLRVGVLYQTDWRDPAYIDLVERARRVTSQAERMKMYREAEMMLIQEVPLVPVIYSKRHLFIKPWVTRYPSSPIQSFDFKEVILDGQILARLSKQ